MSDARKDARKEARRLAAFDQAAALIRDTLTPFLADTYMELSQRGVPPPQAASLTQSMLAAMISLSAQNNESTDDADDAI